MTRYDGANLPPDCPFGGFHEPRPWHDGRGLACWKCHKTWRWEGRELIPTYAPSAPR